MDAMPPALKKIDSVVIVDEFADLMMVAGKANRRTDCTVGTKARAIGIHLF